MQKTQPLQQNSPKALLLSHILVQSKYKAPFNKTGLPLHKPDVIHLFFRFSVQMKEIVHG